MKRYYVYIVRCSDGSYYTGVTSALQCRIEQHNYGCDKLAYTYTRRPVKLVWSQDFANVGDAIQSEKKIKGWKRAKKEALIAGDWGEIQRLSCNRRADESSGA